ncbi:MAG TPA: hypothetical protein VMH81_10015 [Bryobacteraceae bacterium]|nr:hypothetical protein [Bryobacteraceae bacterium]
MTQKRVCLTCKNKGCVNFCRFKDTAPAATRVPPSGLQSFEPKYAQVPKRAA